MQSERWQQVERLYHSALERAAGLRQAALAHACGGDEELRREVESLLAQESSTSGGLKRRPAGEGATSLPETTAAPLRAGAQVGPYKIEAPIGAGGMGQVFRAVDTRLRRTVAIKFLLGRETADPAQRRRFLQDAREKLRRARQVVPEEPLITGIEGLIAAQEGDFQRAEQLADEASLENRKSVTHPHHTWHCAAGVYALCGKPDKAILQLRRCAEMGLPNYLLFGSDPHLRALRDLPEFTALLSDLRREYDQYRVEMDLAGMVQPE